MMSFQVGFKYKLKHVAAEATDVVTVTLNDVANLHQLAFKSLLYSLGHFEQGCYSKTPLDPSNILECSIISTQQVPFAL